MHNIKIKIYKTACAELSFAKVSSIELFCLFVIFALFTMQSDNFVSEVEQIENVFKFRGTISTFPNHLTLYICWESVPYTINIIWFYFVYLIYLAQTI